MKVLLISPASGGWKGVGRNTIFNGKTFRFALLSLLAVAAETPSDAQVEIVDEQFEDIPWNSRYDLVGITCMTAAAPRAYQIAAKFRSMRIPVVLGGMHPTLCPGEAVNHADAIVVGDAEGIWHQVVADSRSGDLKPMYQSKQPPTLRGLKTLPRHLLQSGEYAPVHAVQATRGCPNACDFCSVSAYHNRTQRFRPVEEVCKEIERLSGRFLVFVDDNLTADQGYSRRLFDSLRGLGKLWVTQSTLSIADNPDLVDAAAEGGCAGVFVGLETFSDRNLASVNKTCHRVEKYRSAIGLLHSKGIAVEAGIVFGFDHDGPDVFEKTLRMLEELHIDAIQVSVFTPLPGTTRYEQMGQRIFDRDWSHYDFHNVVFRPARMTPTGLKAGHDWVTREFYRPWRILRRLVRHARRPNGLKTLPYLAVVNWAYYGRVKRWNINGWNPSGESHAVSHFRKGQRVQVGQSSSRQRVESIG
jgi:radical SAM superfamily enzyme YgiQ (UPF0313 family)